MGGRDDQALEQLVALLRASAPDLTQSPAAIRAHFDAMTAALPVADDVVCIADDLGAIPALRLTTPGVAEDVALLYLHGGAYVIGSPEGYRPLAAALGRAAGVTVWAIDYRLAPEHPCPAAIEDALAAYRALLARGFPASRILLAGDSAGGGLAVAMMVALRASGLPQPAAAFLMSPWVDLTCGAASITAKADEDPSLTGAGLRAMAALYLGGLPPESPQASPVMADLSGLPPLLIHVGSAEILLDDAVALARAAGSAGAAVSLEIWPGMVHVWHLFAAMLDAGTRAITAGGAFLAQHLARD